MPKKKKKTATSTRKVKKTAEITEKKAPKKKIRLFSKSKKKEKKEVVQKVAVVKESPTKETPKKVKKEKKPRKPITAAQKQKIRGGILVLIGGFALVFIGYFLFGKLFSPQDLAEITPADKTIAVFEIAVDSNHGQVQQFFSLMEDYPVYQKENMIRLVETVVPYNYEKELLPWMGRKIGFVLYDSVNIGSLGSMTPILFVESRDHNATLNFLRDNTVSKSGEKITETEYINYKIYEFTHSQKAIFTFVNNYLVIVEDKKLLKNYLDNLAENQRLNEDPYYRKVANNLPRGSLIFAFADLQKIFNTLEKDQQFLAQKGQDLLVLRPFLDVFRAEGVTIFADGDRFTAQTFTAIDNDMLDGESYITFSEKYQGEMLAYANDNPVFLAGGHDLTKEINRLEDIFKSGTKTPALVFDGLLEAQKQTYFGKDISLNHDILPLLKGEYLFVVENSMEDPVISLFIELNNKNSDIPRFEKVVNAFVEVSGLFTPKIQEVELPDGTVGQEIVASPEKIQKNTGNYQGNTITSLRLGETGISIHYTILDQIVALSTSQDNIKNSIDRYEGTQSGGFAAGTYYANKVAPVLRTADELMHLKMGALTEAMGLNADQNLAPYLVPFSNLTITKNYFRDGISTIYLIEVI